MNIRDITKQIRVFADQLESQNAPESEKPDPYAELKKAHAEGKVIQGCIRGHWIDCPHPTWKYPVNTYREKPEVPDVCVVPQIIKNTPFQLPPPPPGMQWHRTDGWQEGDLPQKMRPLVEGEFPMEGDECISKSLESKWRASNNWRDGSGTSEVCHYRTRRPLTFTHAGKTWTWHRPGDPMPCDGEKKVSILQCDDLAVYDELGANGTVCGREWSWDDDTIVGWRYADEKKTVPLGPEDVPPGSVFRLIDPVGRTSWLSCAFVMEESAELLQSRSTFNVTFRKLLEEWQINRSLSKGQWNPNAWEPCSKEVDA